MCNLYRIETPQQAMRGLFDIDEDRLGNLPLLEEVFPDQMAPVIRSLADEGGGRVAEMARWGFPPPANGRRPVTNVRNLDSPYWRSWLDRPVQRCLVPATAFCEYQGAVGAKVKRWFVVRDGEEDARPFAFAGIWRDWRGTRGKEEGRFRLFSFLTTGPNELVAPIHPQAMPVLLADASAWERWLSAPWGDARILAEPFPAGRMALLDMPGDLLAGAGGG